MRTEIDMVILYVYNYLKIKDLSCSKIDKIIILYYGYTYSSNKDYKKLLQKKKKTLTL